MEKEKHLSENLKKTDIKFVLISCCTFKRPDILKKSLQSVKNLKLPQDIKIELLVVDNDANGSAKNIVLSFEKDIPFQINYVIEEKRGLSNARNRLLSEAVEIGASHIALFDDDGLLDENWLFNHCEYYNNDQEAHVISGPQYIFFEDDYPQFIKQNNIFKTSTSKENGQILKSCATNNVFLPVEIMTEFNIWFDPSYVFMGGEDGDFFNRVTEAGYLIKFNKDSIVQEIISNDRANIKWILNRSYYNGFSGSLLKFKNGLNFMNKFLFFAKTVFVIIIDCLLIPLSLLGGLTLFFNVLGIATKNYGKMMGAISSKPLNYYSKDN